MTLVGFTVGDASHATLWCDTETYLAGKPAAQASKMAINPYAVCAGTGCGNLLLIREAGAVVTGARSTDEAVAALPAVLRGVACAGGSYGVVGYSTLLGRLVGWEFSYCANYAARMTITWARPHLDRFDLAGEDDALAAAQQQLARIKRDIPAATGGALLIANIDGDRISVGPRFDLITGLRPSRRLTHPAGCMHPSGG